MEHCWASGSCPNLPIGKPLLPPWWSTAAPHPSTSWKMRAKCYVLLCISCNWPNGIVTLWTKTPIPQESVEAVIWLGWDKLYCSHTLNTFNILITLKHRHFNEPIYCIKESLSQAISQWLMDQPPLGHQAPRPGLEGRLALCPACPGLNRAPSPMSSKHATSLYT